MVRHESVSPLVAESITGKAHLGREILRKSKSKKTWNQFHPNFLKVRNSWQI